MSVCAIARASVDHVTSCDPQVVLELENIEEEEELEELEDGKVPGEEEETDGMGGEEVAGGGGEMSREQSAHVFPSPEGVDVGTETAHRSKYKKGVIPVCPYYGCEAFECHLLHEKRPHSQLRLGQVGVLSDDVTMM